MKKITQKNLHEFKPEYGEYSERIEDFAALVGVDTPTGERYYDRGLREWNRTSAIGFTDAELDIVELVHSVAKENSRYDNDPFIHPKHGGDTAGHPIFMGVAFDKFKQDAGFGPESFDPNSPETLKIARISQKMHGMSAVHDMGEMVDISYGEMMATGASRKEPDEEALVAPFQFKLAAYALSTGQPELFGETMRELKAQALESKQELFEKSMAGELTGDEFVTEFGKVIGRQIALAESKFTENDIAPRYREAVKSLEELFEQAEAYQGIEGRMFATLDKFEGSAHYARYAGLGAKEYGEATEGVDPERKLLNRMFGEKAGDSMSYALMNSPGYIDQVKYTVKTVAAMFEALKDVPDEDRAVAEKLVRSVAANTVRITIPLMQKGPAFIDFDADKQSEPEVNPVTQSGAEGFAQRLDAQRDMRDRALPKLKNRKGHVDIVEGVMDAKSVIAVAEKTAAAIESGEFTPDGSSKTLFPVGKPLPEALRVSPAELKASTQKYPLDVASEFKRDQFEGQSVRI